MIKIGKINTNELVEMFGTESNKKTYNDKNKLYKNTKEAILKRAYTECDIIDLGNGEYEILKLRDIKLSQSFYSLNKGIYKHLAPMILKKMLYDYHQDNALTTTNFKYAHTIGMINKNYSLIKKYKTSAVNRYEFNKGNIYNYYKYVDDSIKYYIKTSLDLLKKCDVLKYDEPYMIIYRNLDDIHNLSKININFNDECRVATDLEVRHYTDIEEKIKKELNISNNKEAYFSTKTNIFKEKLLKELLNNPIIDDDGNKIVLLLMFKGYRIWYTTIEKCENLLSEFDSSALNDLIEDFNKDFIDITLNNLKNRTLKLDDVEGISKLILDYEMLTKLTLDYLVEDIELDDSVLIKTIKKGENHFIEILKNEY